MPRCEVRTLTPEATWIGCEDHATAARVASAFDASPSEAILGVRRGARSVVVEHLPSLRSEELLAIVRGAPPERIDLDGTRPVLEIPVIYDGEDLAEVAERIGLSVPEVIARHTAPTYTVAFVGFAAGFGYLTGLDPVLELPRRDRPRPLVPVGAVAIAARYAGVYPRATPGGWHLLGRTALAVWDPERDPPGRFVAGLRVRFVAVGTSTS